MSLNIVCNCYSQGKRLLIISDSNHGLNVVARQIARDFPEFRTNSNPHGLETIGIYHLGTTAQERVEEQANGLTNRTPQNIEAEMEANSVSAEVFLALQRWVQSQEDIANPLSLGSTMLWQLELV